jgi:hypothetical protein
VQPGRGLLDGHIGPDPVDQLLAMQDPTRGEGQHLDDRGGVPPTPVRRRDRDVADGDRKPSQQGHLCVHCPASRADRPDRS